VRPGRHKPPPTSFEPGSAAAAITGCSEVVLTGPGRYQTGARIGDLGHAASEIRSRTVIPGGRSFLGSILSLACGIGRRCAVYGRVLAGPPLPPATPECRCQPFRPRSGPVGRARALCRVRVVVVADREPCRSRCRRSRPRSRPAAWCARADRRRRVRRQRRKTARLASVRQFSLSPGRRRLTKAAVPAGIDGVAPVRAPGSGVLCRLGVF
jgi:hypothetical protein